MPATAANRLALTKPTVWIGAATEIDHVAGNHPHYHPHHFLLGGFSGRFGGYGSVTVASVSSASS
jgi:hypothetical protein